jgi:hypothetical protein
MSKIANRPSEAVHKPYEVVAAKACTDASMLNDKALDSVAGGYMRYRLDNALISSYSFS